MPELLVSWINGLSRRLISLAAVSVLLFTACGGAATVTLTPESTAVPADQGQSPAPTTAATSPPADSTDPATAAPAATASTDPKPSPAAAPVSLPTVPATTGTAQKTTEPATAPPPSPAAMATESPAGTPAPTQDSTDQPSGAPTISMGGSALGGSAETTLLARQILDDPPADGVAWIAYETSLALGEKVEHSHEFAFVYAKDSHHVLTHDLVRRQLESGEGAAISAGLTHIHEPCCKATTFWEIILADPETAVSNTPQGSRLVFVSDPVVGIPSEVSATFVLVRIPPDGHTSVHTHPGPELIYQLSGNIKYQNAIIGTIEMGTGGIEGIPPFVAVQKRNPFAEDGVFLSWFLVDPAQPFASPASFESTVDRGENVASAQAGAAISGVSSNFGRGGMDTAYGANQALDGNPATEWSSHGDGDNAWIEIDLAQETHVTSLGFWTRTMGASAQIFSFRVITDQGEVYGPFSLDDASAIHYFDTDFTAKKLRFEAVESSGGNTGAVEIEVFGEPVP